MGAFEWAAVTTVYAFLTLCLGYYLGHRQGRKEGYQAGYIDCSKYSQLEPLESVEPVK